MAVEEVRLTATGAGGEAKGTDQGNYRVSYSSTYLVKCTDPQDSAKTVLNYFRLNGQYPWIGRTFKFGNDFDTSATCNAVRPSYIDGSGGMYVVACEFSDADDGDTQKQPDQNGNPTEDPFSWVPEIEISYGSYSMPVEVAAFEGATNADGLSPHLIPGKLLPITNSALQPLNPTFDEEFTYKIIRFTTNVRDFDDAVWNKYQDSINRAAFTINLRQLRFRAHVPKHHGKIRIASSLNITNKILYYRRTIELQVRPWNRTILDRGTVEGYGRDDTLPGQEQITDAMMDGRSLLLRTPKDHDDMALAEPFNLDGKGKRLSEGLPPVGLVWRTFTELDFSNIRWV